ncbi:MULTISPECIES: hypothetical protein [Lacticaseibacillus]|uniref:Uncharacterized protein n=1 Tax=Lacticaseibacillus zeae TaxID=57037 RepID=A0A5R8LY83_LACZE|nr:MULTISPECIES: hypothetical protein [Lacticaseibacillus]QVI32472.1 hypothetical protein KG087_02195 [Lacticaseibacillus zeae]TLF42352.1 hypothetical protein FEI14_05520 [Lacticaseibacillus zeae]
MTIIVVFVAFLIQWITVSVFGVSEASSAIFLIPSQGYSPYTQVSILANAVFFVIIIGVLSIIVVKKDEI